MATVGPHKVPSGHSPIFQESGWGVYVTSPYGYRTDPISGKKNAMHKGTDVLLCPTGNGTATATITSIGDGKVIGCYKNCPGKNTSNHTGGNYVYVDHGNGVVTKYFHMKYGSIPSKIQVGATVKQGEKLGYMGTTGYSTGNHLHFQVEINGTPTDSFPYIVGEKTLKSNGVSSNTMAQIIQPKDTELYGDGYQPSIDDILATNNYKISDSDFVKIKHVAGVFGLPYQFLPTADPRLDGSTTTENIGFEYGEKIIKRIPLLFLAPGKASFMTKYSKKNKQSILEKLITTGAGTDDKTSLNDLLDSDGRYYTFEYDTVRYYKFVNPMCRIAARFLGIQDVVINGSKLDRFNWETFTRSGIKSIGDFGNYTAIPFYVDTDTSIHESFSNSTSQSMLASSVNSASDMGKELNFLLGYGANSKGADAFLEDSGIAESVENVSNMASKLLGTGGFFSNLGKHLVTVASGGKLVFPEIWSDSQFSRSYSCKFKFISPDPSNLSVYLNVLVPLFHLMCLVVPQMPENNPNGYTNPFLIRGIYKGMFNVDMGIITNMSVTKGAECQWTPEGIPTSIEVDIDLKDLYDAISITSTASTSWKYDTMNNTALMDYIANLCGINIYKPEITRLIDMWWTNNFSNRATDFFEVDIWGGIQQKIQNLIVGNYR